MIIACPACGTRYAVPDAAIGSEGRTVRCAKCKHSWFQDPPELDLATMPVAPPRPAPESAPEPQSRPEAAAPPPPPPPPPQRSAPAPQPEPPSDGPSISHWRSPEAEDRAGPVPSDDSLAMRALRQGLNAQGEPAAPPPATQPPPPPPPPPPPSPPPPTAPDLREREADDFVDPPFDDDADYADDADEDGGSQFDYRAPFTRRRNTLKMWTIAAAIFALLATGTAVAVNTYGLPEWLPLQRPTFGIGQPGLKLDFPAANQRKEPLANGEVIFRVRGTITNTSSESLDVPNVLVVFSDTHERKIHDEVVVPSRRRLAPGESVTVTEAIVNIPPGAAMASLGWAPR